MSTITVAIVCILFCYDSKDITILRGHKQMKLETCCRHRRRTLSAEVIPS